MLFKYKNCEKCGYTYDSVMNECPHCKEHNVDIEKLGIPQNIFWLQLPLQILLFVVCFYYGGMMLFANIFYVLFGNITNEVTRNLAATSSAYLVAFILGLSIILLNVKGLKKFFLDWRSYAFALGFVVILFVGGLLLNVITKQFTSETSDNQKQVIEFLKSYPTVGLLVMGFVGPVVEEMAYRIGLFSFLRRLNRILAYVVAIIVFALIHFNFQSDNIGNEFLNLPSYLLAGVVFTFAYDFKGPVCATLAHVSYNMISLLMILGSK